MLGDAAVIDWNPRPSSYPDGDTSALFEAQVDRTPDAIAVEHGVSALSYRELDESANRLANRLRRVGVSRGTLVALFVERSPQMIVAMLAIVKAGGAYVPLDPSHPTDRLGWMLDDADPKVVLARASMSARLPATNARHVDLDDLSIAEEPASRLPCSTTGADRAYVMYTSGSTGRPKGACIPHRGIARLVLSASYISLVPSDRVAQAANASFDAATFEIWGALLNGACLVIVDRETVIDAALFAGAIASLRLTTVLLTTGLLNPIADARPECFRPLTNLLFGGEAAAVGPIRKVLAHKPSRLIHVYGPTESTTFATSFEVESLEPAATTVSIGKPISNTTAHILDEDMRPVAVGVPGELYVGGDGNADGYWRRPALTAEKFVPDPFSDRPGATLYRSGDVVCRRPDGLIEFIGRTDNQVKLRGFRIELGEIEVALAACAGVRAAVVVVDGEGSGEQRLVGHVVLEDGASSNPAALKDQLAAHLPEHMIPSAFMISRAFPLTPNGKVDRKALPAPDHAAFAVGAFVAPRTATEEAVARIFADVLRVSRAGAHDDFFVLGGQSLLAARVSSRVGRDLGVALPVRAVFESPTVEALARHIDTLTSATGPAAAPLVKVAREKNRLPLSRLQERLWFLEKLEPSSAAYLIPTATRLRGPLRVDALEKAVAELVRRHESLRTTIEEQGEQVVQVLHDSMTVRFERRDLSRVPEADRERVALEQTRREAMTAFDLRRGPLLRVKLLVLGEQDHVLLITMHHIISDGWSLGVIASDLQSLYETFSAATPTPSPLPELTVQYADYAVWERQSTSDAEVAAQIAWWKTHLAGAPAALELPTDRPRPPEQKHRGAHVVGRIEPQIAERLRAVSRRCGATTYMTLLAAFSALLARVSGQNDIVVATPIVNRTRPETEAMIGFFMNTLALRVDVSGDPTFVELVGRAREVSLESFANQLVPFDRVVQELNPPRDLSRSPVAQVSLNMLNLPDWHVRLHGVEAKPIALATGGSKFDLTLYVEDRDGLALELLYDPDLFDEARMTRFIRRLEAMVDQLATRPTARIGEISLVSAVERQVLPDPTAPLPGAPQPSIPALFDARAAADPDHLAVRDPRRSWTYGEVGSRANQVAHWLAERGVGPGDVVAIYAERSALTVLALLAVMKSGAAFVLLAADYPPTRLVEQIRTAKPTAWINAADTLARSSELDAVMPAPENVIDLADASANAALASRPTTSPATIAGTDARAYIAFTSGTTGGPKGIAGSHAPLAHFVDWHAKTHALGPADHFSGLSGIAHDPFLRDVFSPLSVGASLHLPPSELMLEPDALATWMSREGITVAHLTPSLGEVLALARGPLLPSLRLVCLAGEPLRGELVQSLRKLATAAKVVSFYGATETPQAMGYFVVPDGFVGIAPVGRGIDGVQLLVLGPSGALAGVDEEGEICVRTPHLAIGYVEAEPRETRGFGTNPFANDPKDRVYMTGDRGRFLVDGSVQSAGRIDDQVKVRGFRVELSEVVAALRSHPGVKQATVVLDERRHGLVAYVVGDVEGALLTQALRERLPSYMVPGVVMKLDAIPLTPNGKVDRRALPAPEARASGAASASSEDDGVIATITEIWKDVLDIEVIDIRDNFFDLGGHSLLATRVALMLREAFGVEVSVRTIFEAPTVAQLAERVVALVLASASPEALAAAMEGLDPSSGT